MLVKTIVELLVQQQLANGRQWLLIKSVSVVIPDSATKKKEKKKEARPAKCQAFGYISMVLTHHSLYTLVHETRPPPKVGTAAEPKPDQLAEARLMSLCQLIA